MTLSLTPVSLAFLPVTLARLWSDNISPLKVTQSSQFFVSEVEMVSKCLSHQAPGCVLVSAVPGPACSSLQHCSTRPPNCSCVQRCSQGGGTELLSLSVLN